jgi:hypothetical protein
MTLPIDWTHEPADLAEAKEMLKRAKAEFDLRTAAVIISEGGQALACSAVVAAVYGKLRAELVDVQAMYKAKNEQCENWHRRTVEAEAKVDSLKGIVEASDNMRLKLLHASLDEQERLRALLIRVRPIVESEMALMDSMARHMAGGFPEKDVASADASADFHWMLLRDIDAAIDAEGQP